MDTNKQVPVFVHISKKRLKRGLLFHSEMDDHFNSMFDTLVYTAFISIPVPQRHEKNIFLLRCVSLTYRMRYD